MCLAIPGQIKSIHETEPPFRAGKVDFGGVLKEVNLTFVPEACVGDFVVVHVGMAISIVHEEEAREVFAYVKAMGELEELAPDSPGNPAP